MINISLNEIQFEFKEPLKITEKHINFYMNNFDFIKILQNIKKRKQKINDSDIINALKSIKRRESKLQLQLDWLDSKDIFYIKKGNILYNIPYVIKGKDIKELKDIKTIPLKPTMEEEIKTLKDRINTFENQINNLENCFKSIKPLNKSDIINEIKTEIFNELFIKCKNKNCQFKILYLDSKNPPHYCPKCGFSLNEI